MPQRWVESLVGLFLIFAMIALSVLAFQVSGLTSLLPSNAYTINAAFDEIGGLKVRASVKIGGVQIGEVSDIKLDPRTYKAVVSMRINNQYSDIPDDSSAAILTAGLLGDNYIAITPMYSQTFLHNNGQIQYTHPAMVLEKLIGQFIYKMNGSSDSQKGEAKNAN